LGTWEEEGLFFPGWETAGEEGIFLEKVVRILDQDALTPLQPFGFLVVVDKVNLETTGSSVYSILDKQHCHWQ
jgi:hypothetical protein